MQIRFRLHSDPISADLRRRLQKATNPQAGLQAAGLALTALAQRAFDEPTLRASKWPALKPETIASKARRGLSSGILRGRGTLWRSIRIIGLSQGSVSVGSDRNYARFHQMGAARAGLPARPFFPFDRRGQLTQAGRERVERALARVMG